MDLHEWRMSRGGGAVVQATLDGLKTQKERATGKGIAGLSKRQCVKRVQANRRRVTDFN